MKPETLTKTELRIRITELEHALANVRDGLKDAPNSNVVDYIDAVLDGYTTDLMPNVAIEGLPAGSPAGMEGSTS